MNAGKKVSGIIGGLWGILGISWLFSMALYRLLPYMLELFDMPLDIVQGVALVFSLGFLGYGKGNLILRLRLAPRFAARVVYLRKDPTVLRVIFAPIFCMGFFYATRYRRNMSYAISIMVISLIFLVSQLEQPWRGIIDAGVVFGLVIGLISIWFCSFKAFFSNHSDASPETPDSGPLVIPKVAIK